MPDGKTYLHPCKCMSCGLHFMACSWYETWPHKDDVDDETLDNPVCPECASDALLRWTPRVVEQFIFQLVPGEGSDLVSMGPINQS